MLFSSHDLVKSLVNRTIKGELNVKELLRLEPGMHLCGKVLIRTPRKVIFKRALTPYH